jgi:hypothetical protein
VFSNNVQGKIFGNWRRWHKGELYNSHSSTNTYYLYDQTKKNEMGRACATYGGQEKCMQGFCGVTCGKETT